MPVGKDIVVIFDAVAVPIDVTLLICVEVLQTKKLLINFADGTFLSPCQKWIVTRVSKMGHIYIEWPAAAYYTKTELRRIHRRFHHPAAEKLTRLIKKGALDHCNSELGKRLKNLRKTCDTCQRLAKEPSRFRVSLPSENVVFNRTIEKYLMKIDMKSVLHFVDKDTTFKAATCSEGERSRKVWEAFLSCWVATHVGYPDNMVLDQSPQLQVSEFQSSLFAAGIKVFDAGVESHNALGEVERYHEYFQNIFTRVRLNQLQMNKKIALSLADKACNNTEGPSGMVITLLVFEIVPRMPAHQEELPNQRNRMKDLKIAEKMENRVAKSKLATTVRRNVTNPTDSDIRIGENVFVYCDGSPR